MRYRAVGGAEVDTNRKGVLMLVDYLMLSCFHFLPGV